MWSLWKTVWSFLQKLKIKLQYDPVIPLLGIYLKEMKSLSGTDICIPHVRCSIIHNSQDMETNKFPSTDEWLKKMWMECYSAIKKEGNPAFCNKMDGLWGHHAKWNKSDRERQMYVLTCTWNLKRSQTHRNRVEWWLPGVVGWRKWGNVGQRVQISIYKMGKFWGSNTQRGDYSLKYCIIY